MSEKMSKESRKDLKKPDAFVAFGRKWFNRVAGSTPRVAITLSTVFAIAFGWYGFTRWQAHQAEKAWETFYEAFKKDEPARWEALATWHAQNSGTRAGSFGAIVLGDRYLQLAKNKVEKEIESSLAATKPTKGKQAKEALFAVDLAQLPTEKENSAKAIEWYSKAKSFGGLLAEERQLVEINIANAQEISGDLKAAEQTYQAASTLSPISKGFALLGVGRVAEMQGQKDRAIKVYEGIAQEFSGTEKNREYERLAQSALRRVQSRLLNSAE